jgi:NAD(P)H-dependent FMN reductase
MKLQNKNVAQEASDQVASELPNANPICDIMESGNHRQLVLSQKDLETILQLAQAPPQPTPELIAGFRNAMKKRA